MNAMLDRIAAADIRLSVQGINLGVDAPANGLTQEIVTWLRSHKIDVIESIRLAGPCDCCGSDQFHDKLIHAGNSARRDCASCGRTWGFPVWQGGTSSHYEN